MQSQVLYHFTISLLIPTDLSPECTPGMMLFLLKFILNILALDFTKETILHSIHVRMYYHKQ